MVSPGVDLVTGEKEQKEAGNKWMLSVDWLRGSIDSVDYPEDGCFMAMRTAHPLFWKIKLRHLKVSCYLLLRCGLISFQGLIYTISIYRISIVSHLS